MGPYRSETEVLIAQLRAALVMAQEALDEDCGGGTRCGHATCETYRSVSRALVAALLHDARREQEVAPRVAARTSGPPPEAAP